VLDSIDSSGLVLGEADSDGLGDGVAEIDCVGSGSSATAGALVNVPNKSGKAKKDKKYFLVQCCFTTTVKHTL
jgi:hypothetical protein